MQTFFFSFTLEKMNIKSIQRNLLSILKRSSFIQSITKAKKSLIYFLFAKYPINMTASLKLTAII